MPDIVQSRQPNCGVVRQDGNTNEVAIELRVSLPPLGIVTLSKVQSDTVFHLLHSTDLASNLKGKDCLPCSSLSSLDETFCHHSEVSP